MTDSPTSLRQRFCVIAFALLLIIGIILRVLPGSAFDREGPDEHFYALYVATLEQTGLGGYSELFRGYVDFQSDPENMLMLPPGRVTFIVASWMVHALSEMPRHDAITVVSCAGSTLLLLVCGLFTWRTRGGPFAVAVTAILAVAPLELHLAHLALIDSFFAFWAILALWAQWEVFQSPKHRGWLALYIVAIGLMVLTKETAAFVMFALGGIVIANVFTKFGENSREIWIATIFAPFLGALLLIALAGSPNALFETYWLNAKRSVASPYVILTGDGPWHRYLIELLTVSPLPFVLFCGGVARLGAAGKTGGFLMLYFVLTYLPMTMVCMNLRYTTIWNLPIAWFAVHAIWELCGGLPQRSRDLARAGAVMIVTASQLVFFWTIFGANNVYDPTPTAIQRALSILKG